VDLGGLEAVSNGKWRRDGGITRGFVTLVRRRELGTVNRERIKEAGRN
jgi:hypothetical protein